MVTEGKPSAIVFDFDGTLVDSAPGILDAYATVLDEAGITPHAALDSNLIGPPLVETLIRLSGSNDAGLIRSLTEKFKYHYDSVGVAATVAYPGVAAMLDHLADAGTAMHISTNKRLSVARAILDHLNWQDYFVSVYALDMVEPRLASKAQLLAKQIAEQTLDTARTHYVGDRLEDGNAATENGLGFFYAAWGYGDLRRNALKRDWNWLNEPGELFPGPTLLHQPGTNV